jgi:hypothetical protein
MKSRRSARRCLCAGVAVVGVLASALGSGCASTRPGEIHLRWAASGSPVDQATVTLRGRALFVPFWPYSQIGSPAATICGTTDVAGVVRFAAMPLPGVIEIWAQGYEPMTGDLDAAGREERIERWRILESEGVAMLEYMILVD